LTFSPFNESKKVPASLAKPTAKGNASVEVLSGLKNIIYAQFDIKEFCAR
jgi:hypothetical protein